ncbi:hypothetical protein D3Z62_19285 [Lachnospiraceae bacterium]|nr:hypothetical protein [Lachnospiraceae bacterium]
MRNALFFFYKNSMTLNQVCSTIIISIQNEKTVDKKTSVTVIDIKFGCFLKRKLTAEAGHKAYSPWNDSPETKFWWKQWYKQVIERCVQAYRYLFEQ